MAVDTWKGGSDNWNTAGDWSTGAIPGASDDVVIATGNPEITTNVGSVNSVDNSASLNIENGGALATAAAFVNTGTLGIDDTGPGGSSLSVGGTLSSNSAINLGSNNPFSGIPVTANTTVNVGALSLSSANSERLAINQAVTFGIGPTFGATLNVEGGPSPVQGEVVGQGTFNVAAGVTTFSDFHDFEPGLVQVSGSSTLEIDRDSTEFTPTSLEFAPGAHATIQLDAEALPPTGGTFSQPIGGVAASDTIDLRTLAYAGNTATTTSPGGFFAFNVTVTEGSVTDTIEVSDDDSFVASSDGQGGTSLTLMCFVAGTLISTSRGEVPVEDLQLNDLLATASGAYRPVKWLGRRTFDARSRPLPHYALPVRIAAHAFGAALPRRDLYLSPGHPVLVGSDAQGRDGHLVPIMFLINGTTISRAAVDTVTYLHVELDEHDILLAEGLPTESYIDLGSRPWFAGADGALYDPDMARPDMPGRCRPVAMDGPVVEAERRRLDAVFAIRLASAGSWPDMQSALLAMF